MNLNKEKKTWPSYVASFIINDMTGACKKRGVTVDTCGVSAKDINCILTANYNDIIDRKTTRTLLEKLLDESLSKPSNEAH